MNLCHCITIIAILHITKAASETLPLGLSLGKPCKESNQCQSQRCIQVCNTPNNSNMKQVCGEGVHYNKSKRNRLASDNFQASTCYDTLLKRTKYNVRNANKVVIDRSTSKQQQQQQGKGIIQSDTSIIQDIPHIKREQNTIADNNNRRVEQKSPLKRTIGIGMTCKDSNQCKSQTCINICNNPNSKAKVCGYTWRNSNLETACYDTLLKRTTYVGGALAPHDATIESDKLNPESLTHGQKQQTKTQNVNNKADNMRGSMDKQQQLQQRNKGLNINKINRAQKQKEQKMDNHQEEKAPLLMRVLSYYSTPHRFFGHYANHVVKKRKAKNM